MNPTLEALKATQVYITRNSYHDACYDEVFIQLQEAIAALQAEQGREPFYYAVMQGDTPIDFCKTREEADSRATTSRPIRRYVLPVYATPPAPQPMTDERIEDLAYRYGISSHQFGGVAQFAKALLAAQEGK